jgi:hypothetical protein
MLTLAVNQLGAQLFVMRVHRYVLKYKQSVTANDAFLGMSGRDPSSMSCDELVVVVKLPNTKYADVSLDVTSKELLVQCPRLYEIFAANTLRRHGLVSPCTDAKFVWQ